MRLDSISSRYEPFAGASPAGDFDHTTGFSPAVTERDEGGASRWLDEIDWAAFGAAAAPSPQDVQVPVSGPTAAFVLGAGDGHVVDWDDIDQEGLSNCYLVGTMGALARADPTFVRNMITDNGDGTFNVKLFERNPASGRLERKDQVVDASSFSQQAAGPGDVVGGTTELWPRIIEKAYAQMKGGYSKIGNGGNAEAAMEELTGREATFTPARNLSFEQLQGKLAFSAPVVLDMIADPKGGADDKKQKALGDMDLVWWHSYSVVDAQVRDGVPMVKLYNPWDDDPNVQPGSPKESDGGWVPYQKLVDSGVVAGWQVGQSHLLDRFRAPFGRIFG